MTTIGGTGPLPKQRHGDEVSIQVDIDVEPGCTLNISGLEGIKDGRQIMIGIDLSEDNTRRLIKILSETIHQSPQINSTTDDWKSYGKTWEEFMNHGLSVPGVIIDVDDSEYLIGHINNIGGICNDCTMICDEDIVKRYRTALTGLKNP
jgi:hypothetical protein